MITETHWQWVAPANLPLGDPGGIYLCEGFWNGFLLGQTCEIHRVKYQLLQGEKSLDHLHAYVTVICSFVAQALVHL